MVSNQVSNLDPTHLSTLDLQFTPKNQPLHNTSLRCPSEQTPKGCQDAKNCRHNWGFALFKTLHGCHVLKTQWVLAMPRSIGYARCSTTHQDTVIQTSELESAGCVEVFAEKLSSHAPLEKRHQLRACLEMLQMGDELVVSKLDRLGRSQVEVINRLAD